MAEIFQFPQDDAREWLEWERLIRRAALESRYPEELIAHALPRVREHWKVVFEPFTLELPKRPVPGSLTKAQARAIQSLIDDSAQLVMERLKLERMATFRRLLHLEFALSQCQLSRPSGK